MIVLPNLNKETAQQENTTHPFFTEGVGYKNRSIATRRIEFHDAPQSLSREQSLGHLAQIIFECSADYFVVGNYDNTVFTIFIRCNIPTFKENSQKRLVSEHITKVGISSDYKSSEYTALQNFIGLSQAKTMKICTPEFVEKVRIQGHQIFFRSKRMIYIYSPYSCSEISIRSCDMDVDFYLYVLTPAQLLVFDEQRQEETGISHECQCIASTSHGLYFSIENYLYKVFRGQCVAHFDCTSKIVQLEKDEHNLFAMTATGMLCVVGLSDDVMLKIDTCCSNSRMLLLEKYILIREQKNILHWFNKANLRCTKIERVGGSVQAISAYGNYLCFYDGRTFETYAVDKTSEKKEISYFDSILNSLSYVNSHPAKILGFQKTKRAHASQGAESLIGSFASRQRIHTMMNMRPENRIPCLESLFSLQNKYVGLGNKEFLGLFPNESNNDTTATTVLSLAPNRKYASTLFFNANFNTWFTKRYQDAWRDSKHTEAPVYDFLEYICNGGKTQPTKTQNARPNRRTVQRKNTAGF
ncbi:hypothetical protein ENBRE01_2110 [Enteropsectra breve]|nr:hypothetical protein ENBRE01_2110 [Enteropsectra breve]